MIPYGRQLISEDDITSVVDVLKSDFITQGPQVPKFEQTVASYVGASHAIAVNSATSALHIACLALNLERGDWLWTSPNSFVASANCALYCGANIDFVDIDPATYNMCPEKLASKLEKAKQVNKLPKIIVLVHFAGQSCNMEAFSALSKRFGFKIIEDASHAIGGRWDNCYIGSCQFSDITVFSFHPVKIITTAEGGMLTTNSKLVADKLIALRGHGVTRSSSLLSKNEEGAWYYEQKSLGYNYRLTDIQAALGISQMKEINNFILRRHEIASRYEEQLKNLPLSLPIQHEKSYSSYHLYPIQIQETASGMDRRQFFDELRSTGILVNVHYIPIHTQPYYSNLGFKLGDFPNSEEYYKRTISIPIHAGLSEAEQGFIIENIQRLLS